MFWFNKKRMEMQVSYNDLNNAYKLVVEDTKAALELYGSNSEEYKKLFARAIGLYNRLTEIDASIPKRTSGGGNYKGKIN